MSPSASLPLQAPLPEREPVHAWRRLHGMPHPFLLYSGQIRSGARWSFFGADPFAVYRGDPEAAIAAWRSFARDAEPAPEGVAPFTGGLVGYWAYDFGRRLERVPSIARA